MDILADTSFLIDLWRENQHPGPATAYARSHTHQQVAICWIVAGEFLSGATAAHQDHQRLTGFLSLYPIIHSDEAIIDTYAQIYSKLRATHQLIEPNDLWIAATARAKDLPILTRKAQEFERVHDIRVIDYSTS